MKRSFLNFELFIVVSFGVLIVIFGIVKLLFTQQKIKALYNLHKKNCEMESKMFQLMMNPHFIFNILGDVEYFVIQKDSSKVNEYIGTISNLIRQTIDLCNSDQISIGQEVQYIKSYLNLMKYRFNDDIRIEMNIDMNINLDAKIECMLTQPIVENAIIHGLIPKKGNRELKISYHLKNDNYLFINVQDNGVGIKASHNKTKNHNSIATKSIQKRIDNYNQLHKRKIIIKFIELTQNKKNKGTLVQLSIPLFKN